MPTLPSIVLTGAAIAALSLPSACARNRGEVDPNATRPATGLPTEFSLPPALAATAPVTLTSCISPLIDERTNTQIRLVRSIGGRGDYDVPAGQYGARAEELLRVDCARRTGIGLVLR